jgi:hypothetical protein
MADNYAEIPTRYESSLWDSDGGYNASHVDKLASLKLALGNQKALRGTHRRHAESMHEWDGKIPGKAQCCC